MLRVCWGEGRRGERMHAEGLLLGGEARRRTEGTCCTSANAADEAAVAVQ